ncbi:26S proteasome complex subunit SEM1 isoform X1 [Chlorocebus sabaeus]|uniref:26S proteasome complex subunit SEM1 isoform X1 n=1 Tax=Chlorocebus sabaeus TaxID=60711 RepID=UPI003BFA363E
MSEKKQPVDLGLLEEDDEFEEFPAEGIWETCQSLCEGEEHTETVRRDMADAMNWRNRGENCQYSGVRLHIDHAANKKEGKGAKPLAI